VELVESPQTSGRQPSCEDPLAVTRHVPVEVPAGRAGERLREGRFTDLPRSGYEHHPAFEIPTDLSGEIGAAFDHD
jgi:hypothetical protein